MGPYKREAEGDLAAEDVTRHQTQVFVSAKQGLWERCLCPAGGLVLLEFYTYTLRTQF